MEAVSALIVGGGGREHALAWRLKRDRPGLRLFAAPGNPGIADLATCVPIAATDLDGLLAFARQESVSFTVVGPEIPLAAGIVDRFRAAGLPIFGPTAAAAEIETSKAFSKSLMRAAGVPTAKARICATAQEARAAVQELGIPVVVKASGLAAGKGVIVCDTTADAEAAIDTILERRAFGAAGDTVLVEEFMRGEELSFFVVTDGTRAIPLIPAQDHKRLLDEDRGPNTGGMGAYAPVSIATDRHAGEDLTVDVMTRIIEPTLAAMREAGRPFTGLLYAGLMLTADGPKVVEFNCRFGDPETQAILPILDAKPSLCDLMETVARGEALPATAVVSPERHAVTTVVAAGGYPEKARTGDRVFLPACPPDVVVFHAGTARGADGHLITSGGRVLSVTGLGATMAEAARASQTYAGSVDFEGKQFRHDIGWRELARAGPRGQASE